MIAITPIALIVIILMLITVLLIAALGIKRRLNSLLGVIPLLLFYITAFVWLFITLMFFTCPNHKAVLLSYRYSAPVKTYMYVFLMLFAMHFTKPDISVKKLIWASALVIPTVIVILTLVSPEIIFKYLEINVYYPSSHLSIINGVWFYIDTIYGYVCLSLSIIFFIGHYRSSSVLYKWQSTIFLTAAGAYLLLDLYNLCAGYNDIGGMFGLLALCLILFYTYLYFTTTDLSFLAVGTVFNKISSIVIIVEGNGKILFINTKGKANFSFIAPDCVGMFFQDLLAAWMYQREGTVSYNNGMTVVSVAEGGTTYYEYLKSAVTDKNDLNIGTFIELRDITVQQESIAKLFHLANHDQLTNLFNRRYFENQCDKLNRGEYLPLSFISGDLNNLKYVNDNYGHAYGDKLIIAASEAMRGFTPESGSVCRVGGDEFVIIIPNFPEEEVKMFISRMVAYTLEYSEEPYGKIDISLGYAIRRDMSESIDKVLKEADMVMYKDKERKKISNRQDARPYNK